MGCAVSTAQVAGKSARALPYDAGNALLDWQVHGWWIERQLNVVVDVVAVVDRLPELGPHDFSIRVRWEVQLEMTGRSGRKIRINRSPCRREFRYLEFVREFGRCQGEARAAPGKSQEIRALSVVHFLEDLPKVSDVSVRCRVAIFVHRTALQKFEVDAHFATDLCLQLPSRVQGQHELRHRLGEACANWNDGVFELVHAHREHHADVLAAVLIRHLLLFAIRHNLDEIFPRTVRRRVREVKSGEGTIEFLARPALDRIEGIDRVLINTRKVTELVKRLVHENLPNNRCKAER
mmetsp:Transcript_8816/g.27916  ORF Transcript_8816/g.27916 Transcript_8816/m.27916 type:complete len:293 (+) Transcript_8816:50-928(+)